MTTAKLSAVLLCSALLLASRAGADPAPLLGQGRFTVDLPSYLSQHDLVYLSPAVAPDEGLPLGNGDFCAMQWNQDALNLTLGKSDVWTALNDATAPKTVADYRDLFPTHRERLQELQLAPDLQRWQYNADWRQARPRQGKTQVTPTSPYTLAELALKIGGALVPAQFEERLNLYDGSVSLHSGKLDALTYVAEGAGLVVINVRDRSGATGRRLEVWHWDPQQFGARDNQVWLEHREADGSGYALVVAIAGAPATGQVTEPGHRAALTLADADAAEQDFSILIAAVSTSESPTPLAAAQAKIAAALPEPDAARLARHDAYWHDFWSKSFVDFSDKHLENLWYLNLYYLACQSRGKYPPRFEQGYFGARGFLHWPGGYWQFNEEQLYWPLDPANHPELMEPYTRLIRDVLPLAQLQTRAQFGIDGAQYSHCMTITGQPFDGPGDMIKYVLSTGGLYALYMWQHYQFTQDPTFLREQAYPVMLEVGKFFHAYLEHQVGPDGKYIIYPGHPIEEMDYTAGNTTIDIAVIRALARALLEAEQTLGVAGPHTAAWQDLRDKLPPYPVQDGVLLSGRVYSGPPFRVLPATGGWDTLPSWCEFPAGWQGGLPPDKQQYIGMGTQLAPVFPTAEIGLSSDPASLELARQTYLRTGAHSGSWSPDAICGARLGMRDQVLPALVEKVRWTQVTANGLLSYAGNRDQIELNWASQGRPFAIDRTGQTRYQAYFEVSGGVATAIAYTLLDSLDGVIRLFPALPLHGDARIVLRASGDFLVTAEMRGGEIAYAVIQSQQGAPCRVANPWPSGAVRVRLAGGRLVVPPTTDRLLTFPTVPGGVYFVEREAQPADSFPRLALRGERQTGPRYLLPGMLGLPREGWPRYPQKSPWLSDFVPTWRVSRLLDKGAGLAAAPAQTLADPLDWRPLAADSHGFVNVHPLVGEKADGLVYLETEIEVKQTGSWGLYFGHDGGIRVFVDGQPRFTQPHLLSPALLDRSRDDMQLTAGRHTILVVLDTAQGMGWGIFLRFQQSYQDRRPGVAPAFPACVLPAAAPAG